MIALLLILAGPGHAASPWTLPPGASSAYAGAGMSTFATGMSGLSRDRYLQLRLGLWAGRGLTRKTQVEASLPLIYTRALEDADEGPCPSRDTYCTPSLSAGSLELAGTTRILDGGLPLAVRYGVQTDAWNASRRGRWTNPGQGTSSVSLDVLGELARATEERRWRLGLSAGGAAPWPARAHGADGRIQRWAPAPSLRASVTGGLETGRIGLELGVMGQQRLWGEAFGATWVQQWRPVIDRWRVTRWAELRPQAKLSLALPGAPMGVHLGVSRSVWVRAGPPDLWDVSLGVHHYWQPADRGASPAQ